MDVALRALSKAAQSGDAEAASVLIRERARRRHGLILVWRVGASDPAPFRGAVPYPVILRDGSRIRPGVSHVWALPVDDAQAVLDARSGSIGTLYLVDLADGRAIEVKARHSDFADAAAGAESSMTRPEIAEFVTLCETQRPEYQPRDGCFKVYQRLRPERPSSASHSPPRPAVVAPRPAVVVPAAVPSSGRRPTIISIPPQTTAYRVWQDPVFDHVEVGPDLPERIPFFDNPFSHPDGAPKVRGVDSNLEGPGGGVPSGQHFCVDGISLIADPLVSREDLATVSTGAVLEFVAGGQVRMNWPARLLIPDEEPPREGTVIVNLVSPPAILEFSEVLELGQLESFHFVLRLRRPARSSRRIGLTLSLHGRKLKQLTC